VDPLIRVTSYQWVIQHMPAEDYKIVNQEIGLKMGIALVIGATISIAPFFLPTQLIANTGIGTELSIVIFFVLIPILLNLIIALQLTGAMPVSGGDYVYASRLIHPVVGFLLPWLWLPVDWLLLVFTARGFASYIQFWDIFAGIDIRLLIFVFILFFLIINLLGIRITAQVQTAMVGIVVIAMLIFIVPGALHTDIGNYTPMFKQGYGPFIVAILSLGTVFAAYRIAMSMGEELRNAKKNIPRVTAIAFVISFILVALFIAVAVGVVPLDFYVRNGEPLHTGLAVAATTFLPRFGAWLVVAGGLFAAFTTVNAQFIYASRPLMRAARDYCLPKYFAAIHPRFDTPYRAILLVGVPPLLLVLVNPSVVAITVALGVAGLVAGVFNALTL
jgi:APA family basic amino acid/polyamine antiporter